MAKNKATVMASLLIKNIADEDKQWFASHAKSPDIDSTMSKLVRQFIRNLRKEYSGEK